MENFDWTSFTRKIPIKSSVQSLYDAWTIPQEIVKWFLSSAKYTLPDGTARSQDEHIQKGDQYQWMWHTWHELVEEGKVISTNGKDNVQFTFAGDCIVDIQLVPIELGTLVTLTQSNIPTDEKSKKDIRLGCYEGWSFYMVNLKSIYEGGIDLRNMDDRFMDVVNT